ncbi:MAG: hypothetical protein FWF11_04675, partial [Coriobacteriia bacterium]|nr:hypothetical protein [Coriobacteriia bacterium]
MLKRGRTSKLLLALVLVVAVSAFVAAIAFANEPPGGYGTLEAPAQAVVTKELRMPEGTTPPEGLAFQFTFTQLPEVGDPDVGRPSGGRAGASIPTTTIAFSATDTGTVTGGILSIVKESGDFLANATFPGNPDQGGIFIFDVRETQTIAGGTLRDDAEAREVVTFDEVVYQLHVMVRTEEGQRYIWAVWAQEYGVDLFDGPVMGGKIDVSPDPVEGLGMRFVNNFVRTVIVDRDPDDPDPNDPLLARAPLVVSKEITGDFASFDDVFDFDMQLRMPRIDGEFITDQTVFTAWIVDTNSDPATIAAVVPNPIVFTLGTGGGSADTTQMQRFQLRGGQELRFSELPIGITYTLTERAHEEYRATATITSGGSFVTTLNAGAVDTDLPTGPRLVADDGSAASATN